MKPAFLEQFPNRYVDIIFLKFVYKLILLKVFNTQLKHEDIRNDCLKYADENRHVFPDLVDDWDTYLSKLKNHTIICGTVELQIISKKYKLVILFILNNCAQF